MKKNGKIELLRFLFSIGVLSFHIQKYLPGEVSLKDGIRFHIFPHGAMGVEFFFVLSGFLMASSAFYANEHQKDLPVGEATFAFIKNKYTSLLPMRFIVFVLLFAASAITKSWRLTTVIKNLISNIPGFLLVQMSGFGENYINHIEWYLSVMLLGMLVIYPFLRKKIDVFAKIVAPLVSVFVLGYMYQSYGRLTGVTVWEGLCYRSVFRGVAELSLGIVCFVVCQKMKDIQMTSAQKCVFTGIEILCWLAAFAMMLMTLPCIYEFYILTFIVLGTICSFSGLSYGGNLFNKGLFYYLGKLSLPVYLCQLIPIMLIPEYLGFLPMKWQMIITFAATMILAVVILHTADTWKKGMKLSRKC